MLAVNNSKNPAHDAKSCAKYSKVGEEAGSCCNHSQNAGEGDGGAMVCSIFDERLRRLYPWMQLIDP